MSIRLRLALVVALATSLLVAVGGLLCAAILSSGMRATLQDDLRRSALRLAAGLEARRIHLGTAHPVVDAARIQSVVQVMSLTGRLEYTTERAGARGLLSASQRARASQGRLFVARRRQAWRNPRLLLAEPVPGTSAELLVVGASLDELENARTRLEVMLLTGGTALVLLATFGGYLLAGRALRPVERLRAEAAAISETLPDRRLAEPATRDEVARLAGTLNRLLDRLQGALGRQREFVAVASHELRTPLAVLSAELEIARRPGRSEEELHRSLDILGQRVELLTRLADDLLLLARGDEQALGLHRCPQLLEPLVADTLASLCQMADAHGVTLALDADPTVAAAVDGGRFQQVVDNLVHNAVEHGAPSNGASGSGASSKLVEVSVRGEAAQAVVEIRDHGPGFADEVLPRAFERFTRAEVLRRKSCRGGAGLGLAIVRLLVEAHDGTVVARNLAGGGASVLVRLPACSLDASPAAPTGVGSPDGNGKEVRCTSSWR